MTSRTRWRSYGRVWACRAARSHSSSTATDTAYEWDYDHPIWRSGPLKRGWGIIVWQEQVVQLLMDVGDMSAAQADEVRRAFARPNNEHLIAAHWRRFLEGARKNEVPDETAKKIFGKVNGHYMFPESHSACVLHHRVPGGLAEAIPSDRVLHSRS